ncbi:hypothetical protein QNF03_003806 [Vibrio cidicii]|nr:hypothetical protein [Vibrio cidicii]
MSLKDLLPTGSPQNKIEYLADLIESRLGQSSLTMNLLPNGEMNLNMALMPNPPFINTNEALPFDLTRTLEYGRNAIAAGFGWGYEISNTPDSSGYCIHEISNKLPYSRIESIPQNNGVLKCVSNGDGVAYTVFSAPQGGKALNALKGRMLIGTASNAEVTVGLALLIIDPNTGKVKIAPQKNTYLHVYTKASSEHYLNPTWIETPELTCQLDGGEGLYALYAHVKNDSVFMVYGAEAFHSSEETNPKNGTTVTLSNPIAMQQYQDYFRLVKKDCTELVAQCRLRWKFPRNFSYTFAPEHHISTYHNRSYEVGSGKTAQIVEYGSNYLVIEYSQALFDELNDHSVLSVSYSANPVGIRFYEA